MRRGRGDGRGRRDGAESALEGLDPQQRRAVLAPRGPVCILAGAGTGKTRTITRRIAHLVTTGHVRGDQVLAVTFTARAAGELRMRLAGLGVADAGTGPVQARTFHSAALRNLSYFWPRVYGEEPWQLLDGQFRAVAQAVRRVGLDPATETIRDVLTEIGWAKSSLLTPDTYAEQAVALGRDLPVPAPEVARAFRAYEDLKVSGPVRMLDFDDLLSHMAELVEEVPAIAEEFRDRYRCFVVDEFQDVTPAQQRLLTAWLGRRDDLTVVGDVNQTIYSFAGAEPDFLLGFADRYPGATVVRLESDYRSTPQVVDLANAVIGAGSGRFRSAGLTLRGMRPPGPEPVLAEYPDEDAEAGAVAGAVADLVHGGMDPSEIAVLYRINAQSERVEAALDEAGIGYRLKGGEGFFERPVVRRAMSAIDRLIDGSDEARAQAYSQLSDPTEIVAVIRQALEPLGLTAAEPSGAQARETWNSLNSLVGLAEEIATAEAREGLLPVVAGLRERAAARHAPDERGVTLASFHAAKGLEWDAVFLIGVHEGSLPISHAINAGPDAIEEERRLLYVGVTRAREHLTVSWSRSRRAGGRASRRPSRFLDPVRPAQSPVGPRGSTDTSDKGRCRGCGEKLTGPMHRALGLCPECSVEVDTGLFERLRDWRKETSERIGKPAYTVFTNDTLAQIARERPADTRALGRIGGIGAHKLSEYGDDVLKLIRAT
ncbi:MULTISPECIES: ATP-dependent DNA helicase UvrD2 [Dietzia]|uniref:DNA 3'-5' helicase n=1 Tax=Dietzia maris TaxID=37915 RepID=A0ABT8H300_9ACTN|nr:MULTISPECIES: ATP-dependent DNA helicase UvrD2 [Dietzia]MBB0990099.1 ATP-dependent DNA helicase UvrD2 [Dietzia sp. SLG510A3-30A2]MBB0993154.1 ATP-dependent DNA helicase UvrD2 [Dietzia sp. SLG510A3-40A3]MBB0998443.1 ATP-dependent DNA helicase UvrD2 [Dietzia maris]MCZ4539492.1 ATP-dependent DNA helicase UvrD2 [Dietzia maris]MDJ0423196.1 ATP-dependent DNA helicase UvrD2 [Dietzia kunjamensis]